MGAYVFLCNDGTRAEVFERQLLGTRAGLAHLMPVHRGDLLFLYDYTQQAGELDGPFIATTDAAKNLEPRAWDGRFPWQVRFERRFEYRRLRRHEFERLVSWSPKGSPEPRLTWRQANELRKLTTSGEIAVRDLPPSDRGYLFLCNNDTAVECFDSMVFGATGKVQGYYRPLRPGDWLFLYNFQKGELYGPFRALSGLEYRESSDLFGNHFPYQVDVEYVGSDRCTAESDLRRLVEFRGDYPPRTLQGNQVSGLLSSLEPSSVRALQGPALQAGDFRALDGHLVRSRAELLIDNGLADLKIHHHYEDFLLDVDTGEEYRTDWYLPELDTYVEYWELQDPDYLRRKEAKKRFYARQGLRLVELGKEDLTDVSLALRRKLQLTTHGTHRAATQEAAPQEPAPTPTPSKAARRGKPKTASKRPRRKAT